eukprot:Nk52_evm8s148 gene=Nk52_evmTU8s148
MDVAGDKNSPNEEVLAGSEGDKEQKKAEKAGNPFVAATPVVVDASNYDQLVAMQKAGATLTKGQLRKMRKHERWLAKREERRANRGEEKRRKRQRIKEAREAAIKAAGGDKEAEAANLAALTRQTTLMKDSSSKQRVVFDMAFNEYMALKDLRSLLGQMERCYSANRYNPSPMHMYWTSVDGVLKQVLEEKHEGYKRWDVNISGEDYHAVFGTGEEEKEGDVCEQGKMRTRKDQLVYLTADSPNVVGTLEEDKIYIIGGIVDHNVHKELCLKKAEREGIQHGRLPIGEYVRMSQRKVLAVNHVYEILLEYQKTKDWKIAFTTVIPQRKIDHNEKKGESAQKEENGKEEGMDKGKGKEEEEKN